MTNKKMTIKMFTVLAVAAFAVNCASTPDAAPRSLGGDMLINSLNGQLDQASLMGFDVWGTKVDTSKYETWAATSAPIVKGILDKTPDGYSLEVQGHADADGAAAANQRVSTTRAKIIYDALKKQGVTSPKLTYKGYGSSNLKNTADPSSSENRRVGFQIVKK